MEEIVGLNICYNSNWTKKTYVALYIYSTILPSVTIGGRRNTKTKHQLYRRVISREGQLAVFFEVCAIKNCRRQERGLRTPFLCPTDFYSKKKLQIALHVKSTPYVVGVLFSYFLSHQLWQPIELLDVQSKKAIKFLFILEQIRV